ncbi:MAG: response regulator [Chloroflexi bacterium]|nr:response regulator [Chloroflexota bacterium]
MNNDKSICDLLRVILMRGGYECTDASSSRQALEILQTQAIDLIIQNLCRPGMDGCKFYTRLQQDQHLATIPILIITPLHPLDLSSKCQALVKKLYPHNFISMPFCPQTIITKVQTQLQPTRNSAHNTSSSSYNIDLPLKMASFC